jgi:hypothetical protein
MPLHSGAPILVHCNAGIYIDGYGGARGCNVVADTSDRCNCCRQFSKRRASGPFH